VCAKSGDWYAATKPKGAAGLVSRGCNRPSNHHIDEELAQVALMIVRERYADFGPTLACEKLRERHGIVLAKETVRKFMTEAGLWIPLKQRPPSIYQPRNRRSCVGELIQIDGSDHHWFEDRAPACTLLVFIECDLESRYFNCSRRIRYGNYLANLPFRRK
jgi:hypothetical protein